jgi:mono/diheme cytochrome c family protein
MMRALLIALLLTATAAHADQDGFVDFERGRALVAAGDCVACHTATGQAPFAGGRAIETPFGVINSANLTTDAATGIGGWTEDEFARAMQHGIGKGGRHLYPAFPYPFYTRVSRDDLGAIFTYLRTLPPVRNPVKRSTLPFPLNIRFAMTGWNLLFFTPGEWRPDPARSDAFNRGAYLVEGLGHCGACHTPMNMLGGSKASVAYQGNQLQNWWAPNITNDPIAGIGAWSVDEIAEYLRTGRNARSAATGPMAEVVEQSTAHMRNDDLLAMATDLKERGAAGPSSRTPIGANDPVMQAGRAIYVDTCQACHAARGEGVDRLFPRLAGSASVQQSDVTTLARVLITGTRAAGTAAAPTAPAMPSFGWRLGDAQAAAVLTYIRNAWGNAAPAVSAGDIDRVRNQVTSQ